MKRMTAMGALVVVLALSACGGGSANSKEISSSDLGESWPLTVSGGTLHCEGSDGVGAVTIEVDGTTYALNGIAEGQGAGVAIDPIWAANPEIEGAKKNIGVLVSEGLALCS